MTNNNNVVYQTEEVAFEPVQGFSITEILGADNEVFNTDMGTFLKEGEQPEPIKPIVSNEQSKVIAEMLRDTLVKDNAKKSIERIQAYLETSDLHTDQNVSEHAMLLMTYLSKLSRKKAKNFINNIFYLLENGDWYTFYASNVISVDTVKQAFYDIAIAVANEMGDDKSSENQLELNKVIGPAIQKGLDMMDKDFERLVVAITELDYKASEEIGVEISNNIHKYAIHLVKEVIDNNEEVEHVTVQSDNPKPILPVVSTPVNDKSSRIREVSGDFNKEISEKLGMLAYQYKLDAKMFITVEGDVYFNSPYTGQLSYVKSVA